MQLDITGHQIDLTDALQQHVRGKMRKLARHSDEITHMHVVFNIEKHSHQAEATAHVPGAELFANADAEDMYAAIDLMVDKLASQARRYKEKVRDHKATPTSGVVGAKEAQLSRECASELDAELDAMGD